MSRVSCWIDFDLTILFSIPLSLKTNETSMIKKAAARYREYILLSLTFSYTIGCEYQVMGNLYSRLLFTGEDQL